MSQILTSIHGKKLGLDHEQKLVIPNGARLGAHGKQINLAGPDDVVLFDDFTRGFNTSVWQAVEGTDSATSAAAILSGGIGGVLRLTTGDAGTGYAEIGRAHV